MFEPGRVRPSSRPGLSVSNGSAPGTPRGRPATPSGPPLSVADAPGPQLAMLDDASYFSVMRQDILLVQRRLRAFATPRKGTEVSEASLQLIVGGSNVLHAKLALHELMADRMVQLERALVQATANGAGADGAALGTGGASRLSYYLVALDRLQRLHAQAFDAPNGANGAGARVDDTDALLAKLRQRELQNATLERELMELQSTLRVQDADAQRRVDAARAESAAAGADALRHCESSQRTEEERLRDALARADEALVEARGEADAARARAAELDAALAELHARASPDAAAKAAAREESLAHDAAALEAALAQRDATIAGLKRALSELEAKAGSAAAAAADASAAAALEAQLSAEKAAARNSLNYMQARIDQLAAQLDLTSNDDNDKSMLKHMHAENERLQAEITRLADVLTAVKRELELVQRPPGDDFDDVMIEELRNMRESFEAKLAAASEVAKDRQAAHRREIRELREAHDKERAVMESRIAYLAAKLPH
ncbi:hypothetical protein KFE25_000766 [Diacronema lutheri]|uniref:Uncharacterized protein n=2 Tax=Diacronema lutheri TaxID=2081491 RepID=A0A8J6CEZ4_DIALT|nr:hypothetical protein KFE25_000766 [Diacronema lutheri]